ncbi:MULTISPECIES: hypothetical protein [Aeromicrobium]|uniref:hypothetical protein n=1 Tax=Aeromicrobium TaxID=2040 RepID=UPI002580C50A|nr:MULTISPECIES: hypothetical protein [Aeromicrobium]
MDDILSEAMAPVLRDLARSGLTPPRIDESDWSGDPDHPSAMMWAPDGTGRGISVQRSAPEPERLASAADQVQEWAIESILWGTAPTNWPQCPRHPAHHPLLASTSDTSAVWVCPTDRAVIGVIGSL